MTWAEFWWNQVTGPADVVKNIAEQLLDGRNVAINVPDDMPWRHEMRTAVEDYLCTELDLDDAVITQIDGDELPQGEYDPAEYLLNTFARRANRQAYRPWSGQSAVKDLADRLVLRDQVIWVKGLDLDAAKLWLTLCEDYRAGAFENGVIVVEARGLTRSDCERVSFVDVCRNVTLSDARLMNSVVVADRVPRTTDLWKRYETSLVTHLCGDDVETAQAFIEMLTVDLDDPISVLRTLAQGASLRRRGNDNEDHALSLCRAHRFDKLYRRIWDAQVEVLFPLFESDRFAVVERFYADLQDLLAKSIVEQFGARVYDPRELELGTIAYLMESDKLSTVGHRIRERVQFLRDCRYQMAHGQYCSVHDVVLLIEEPIK